MKSEESGSTLRTAIQPPHLDIRRRSPSQDESAPVIELSHRADSGRGGLGPRNHQPRAGREYRIDRPHASQIPARRAEAALFHLFFSVMLTLSPNTLSGGGVYLSGVLLFAECIGRLN